MASEQVGIKSDTNLTGMRCTAIAGDGFCAGLAHLYSLTVAAARTTNHHGVHSKSTEPVVSRAVRTKVAVLLNCVSWLPRWESCGGREQCRWRREGLRCTEREKPVFCCVAKKTVNESFVLNTRFVFVYRLTVRIKFTCYEKTEYTESKLESKACLSSLRAPTPLKLQEKNSRPLQTSQYP